MTDDLVKRLREGDEFERFMLAERAADRIEELEAVVGRQHKRAETLAEGWRIADDARIELEAKLAKAVQALDDLISTYVWVREDEYERGWSEMSNAVHEATFVQMELTGGKDD